MKVLMSGAYLVAGNDAMIGPVLAHVERSGISFKGNPDVHVRSYSHFGIDDALELRNRAQMRALKGGMRTFVVHAAAMTTEAQNALLKTLEEPPADAIFIFIVPAPPMLLPTILSRSQILEIEAPTGGSRLDVNSFLQASASGRIKMLDVLLEKGEDDTRDIGAIINFLADLERSLSVRDMDARASEAIRAVYRARSYAGDKGALLKPLLESVALLV